jgi:hypothetical protein
VIARQPRDQTASGASRRQSSADSHDRFGAAARVHAIAAAATSPTTSTRSSNRLAEENVEVSSDDNASDEESGHPPPKRYVLSHNPLLFPTIALS